MSIGVPKQFNQSGSSLIETLIALFVLAIGLLGVISMQAIGVKSNQRSHFSSEALILANDMVDRIYAYDDVDDDSDDGDFNNIDTKMVAAAPACIATGCTAEDQVKYVASEWQAAFQSRLPLGRGTVSYDAAKGIYTVTVMWDNEMTGAVGTGCSGNANMDLACYLVEVAL